MTRDLGWLEGILDGEGYIGLHRWTDRNPKLLYHRIRFRPWLEIASTDIRILERVKSIIGGGNIYQRKLLPGRKQAWVYFANSSTMRRVLPTLHLTSKESQRRLILEVLELQSKHRPYSMPNQSRIEQIYDEMKRLNRRGREMPACESLTFR